MFQTRYKNTIYSLYQNSPQHYWFFELTAQLDELFSNVSLDNVAEKQHAYQAIINQYGSHVLYQRLSALHTDLIALSHSNDILEFPCGPGGINLYYNDDFVLTFMVSDKMPLDDNRYSSLVYNSSIFCLRGEIPVRHWKFREPLGNAHWDRQFSKIRVHGKETYVVKPGSFLTADCQSGFYKIDKHESFVALSITTKPLLDMQLEFERNTLKPLHMIDANSDKSRAKMILKILPTLARSDYEVEDILKLGLASNDHTVRWEAIKASVLAKADIAEDAVMAGLKDSNDDVRQSCKRMISECSE